MNRDQFQHRINHRFPDQNINQSEIDRMYRQHLWEEEQRAHQMMLIAEAARAAAQQYSGGGGGSFIETAEQFSFNLGVFNNSFNYAIFQPDGKLVAGGSFTQYNGVTVNYITRLNTDGSIDDTFNIGSGFDSYVNSVALQDDGKIVVGGAFTTYDGTPCRAIIRLNSDGTIDPSFNIGTGFAVFNVPYDVAIQSNGNILVVGYLTNYKGNSISKIVSINPDGSFDSSFSTGSGFDSQPRVMEVQSDGKILIAGEFTSYDGTPLERMVRLNTDGTIDGTFSASFTDPSFCYLQGLTIQPDDKIIVTGQFVTCNSVTVNNIARLNPDGTLDVSFNTGTGFYGYTSALALDPDGKIFIGGIFRSFNDELQYYVIRLNPDGTKDSSFTNNGYGYETQVRSIIADEINIVTSGYGSFTYPDSVTRLNSDGTLGNLLTIGTGFNDDIATSAAQSDGKFIFGGYFTSYNGTQANRIARLNTDGTIDLTFGATGGFDDYLNKIILQPDGKILAGGYFFDYGGVAKNSFVRLNTDGSLDNTFAAGVTGGGFTGDYVDIYDMAIQPDNKILIGGYFEEYGGSPAKYLIRVNLNGTLDETLNTGGATGGFNNQINIIALQEDGKIITGGYFTAYNGIDSNRIIRLDSDGSLDSSFNVGTGFDDAPFTLAIQADGKIIAGGDFITYNGDSASRIVRLNTDGTIDSTFNIGTGFNDSVYSIVLQGDGKILVGGDFTSYNGEIAYYLIRLNIDGSVDRSFDISYPTLGTNLDALYFPGSQYVLSSSDNINYSTNISKSGVVLDPSGYPVQ